MTIPSTPRKAGPFLGNGATTSFPFAFKVFAPTDVKVVVADSAGVETVLALNSDYSVRLNANQDTSPGGTITYPISGSPLPSGSKLSIIGNISYDQPLGLPSGGNFSPLALENQLDRTTMQIQQLAEQQERVVSLPVTANASARLPQPEAGKFLAWNSIGTGLVNADAPSGGANTASHLGPKATHPTTRNDGSALSAGDLYFNTTTNTLYVYGGTAWSGVSGPNIGPASETAAGIVELATVAEVQAGTDTARAVTPAGLAAAGAPKLRTARTITIGNTGKLFDGSADVSWTLAEIGVAESGPSPSHTHTASQISDSTTVGRSVLTAADQAAARSAIGAAASSHTHTASQIDFTPDGAGAVARTVQAKLREFMSVKDFGAVGDGVADDTAAIQRCIDAANPVGATVYFPPGQYKVTSALTIDNTGDTDATAPKASIVGAGKTSARILAGPGDYSVIRLLGGTVSAGMHSHQKIEGISITKSGGNGDGIYLSNIAYFAMRDVLVLGAAVGLRGVDVLSSNFTGCQFLFNTRGVDFVRSNTSDGYQSGPNALTFVSCVLGNNGNSGGYFSQGGCINFIGGSVEGNGISGSGTSAERFGLRIDNAGLESAVGLNVFGTYFEANRGTADVWLVNTAHSVTHSLTGATFNRIDSLNHVSHNVFVETRGAISTDVRLNGCGFVGLGTYSPSGSRLTIHQIASSGGRNRLSWDGCYFSSTVDAPIARNYSAAVAAFGAVTANGSLVGDRMNVASVVRNAAGDYTITYAQPLETNRPAAIATPYGYAVATVFGIDNNIIRFRFTSPANGSLMDTDFSFVVIGR